MGFSIPEKNNNNPTHFNDGIQNDGAVLREADVVFEDEHTAEPLAHHRLPDAVVAEEAAYEKKSL